MAKPDEDRPVETTLGILNAVQQDERHTQRSLAQRLGVALGLTNAVLKRCVRKGLIKVQQAPARRYAYYLTPKGFAEKNRLVGEYLSVSLDFFRRARTEYDAALHACKADTAPPTVVLVGASELTEIAILAAQQAEIDIAYVLDRTRNTASYAGLPVVRALAEIDGAATYVLTDTQAPQALFDWLSESVPVDRILTPPLLHVSRTTEAASMRAKVAGGRA